ncbi:MAG: helix-turn-helix domain-containing protein [Micrococcales bacterium]|nr:helix-turn-helix domain-containing protein [Micrococcales bacterium]
MLDDVERGRRIQQLADAVGLSQRRLAAATGISQPTLSRIISGVRPAHMAELVQIASVLGRPVTSLTEENPVAARVQFAHRLGDGADATQVRQRLTQLLEIRALLDEDAS